MQEETPSAQLGRFANALQEIRSWSFPSARALFQKRELSFSYGTYILFERGERLPSARQLAEIIRALEAAPEPLLLAWAAAQFEDPELRAVFEEKAGPQAVRPSKPAAKAPGLPKPSLDNTWVLNKRDIDEISKAPWLWDAISDIVTAFPRGVAAGTLAERYGHTAEALEKKHLKRWIASEEIRVADGNFIPSGPFVHLPATAQSDRIRNESIRRAAERIIVDAAAEPSLKRMLKMRLNEKTAQAWAARLEQLVSDFRVDAARGGGEKRLYEFILLFAGQGD